MSRLAVTKLLLSGSSGPPWVQGIFSWAWTAALVASKRPATSAVIHIFKALPAIRLISRSHQPNCSLYIVHCALCITHCALYIVHCALYIVHYALCIVHCTLCIVHCALYIVHCTLCIVHYELCINKPPSCRSGCRCHDRGWSPCDPSGRRWCCHRSARWL